MNILCSTLSRKHPGPLIAGKKRCRIFEIFLGTSLRSRHAYLWDQSASSWRIHETKSFFRCILKHSEVLGNAEWATWKFKVDPILHQSCERFDNKKKSGKISNRRCGTLKNRLLGKTSIKALQNPFRSRVNAHVYYAEFSHTCRKNKTETEVDVHWEGHPEHPGKRNRTSKDTYTVSSTDVNTRAQRTTHPPTPPSDPPRFEHKGMILNSFRTYLPGSKGHGRTETTSEAKRRAVGPQRTLELGIFQHYAFGCFEYRIRKNWDFVYCPQLKI